MTGPPYDCVTCNAEGEVDGRECLDCFGSGYEPDVDEANDRGDEWDPDAYYGTPI